MFLVKILFCESYIFEQWQIVPLFLEENCFKLFNEKRHEKYVTLSFYDTRKCSTNLRRYFIEKIHRVWSFYCVSFIAPIFFILDQENLPLATHLYITLLEYM